MTIVMKNIVLASSIAGLFLLSSCQKTLDLAPTNELTTANIYKTAEGYQKVIPKVYGALATTGNNGPAGSPDIATSIIDEGFSDFNRSFWYLQELPTEEAKWSYYDNGTSDINTMTWTPNNTVVKGLFKRAYFNMVLCNEFIEQSTDSKLSERGIGGNDAFKIKQYREEARFLRAFYYWVIVDLYGKGPFVTAIVSDPPPEKDRKFLFNFIETELLDLQNKLGDPRMVEYGRVDKASAWSLLARLYLNAEVYTGTARPADAMTYAKKVIDAGYSLHPNYDRLFMADNHLRRDELIFSVPYDGVNTQGYGGANQLVHGGLFTGLGQNSDEFGVNGGWNCIRITKNLPMLFADSGFGEISDKRAMFNKNMSTIDISKILAGTDGYKVTKFRNITLTEVGSTNSIRYTSDSIYITASGSNFVKGKLFKLDQARPNKINDYLTVGYINSGGEMVCKSPRYLGEPGVATIQGKLNTLKKGNDIKGDYVDIDYPLFRLAEMYLIYAEAALQGGGDMGMAKNLINQIRERAYGNSDGNINVEDITMDFLLAERARELYWEGHRRTDLIRHNKFVEGNYLWPFKANAVDGKAAASYLKLYPIPAVDITSNPNLTQNPGY